MKCAFTLFVFIFLIGCEHDRLIKVQFDRVDGLHEGANVVESGITIGKVTKMELGPEARILVTCMVKDKMIFQKDTRFELKQADFIGTKCVEIFPGSSTEIMPPDHIFKGTMNQDSFGDKASTPVPVHTIVNYFEQQDSILIEMRALNKKVDRLMKRR